MFTKPRQLLRLEGALVFLLSMLLYKHFAFGWGFFALLFFIPDISMFGYLIDPKLGSATYNCIHTYIAPLLLVLVSFVMHAPQLIPYCLIWTAHIGFDRTLGYGLKYPTQFRDTHLQHV